jgi:hypothetical protein
MNWKLSTIALAGATLATLVTRAAPASAQTTFLTCSGLACETNPAPLPNNVDQTTTWTPCGGAPFWWYGSIDLEAGYDELTIDGELYTGATSISGRGVGTAEVSVFTDQTIQSAGIVFLEAICDDNQTYIEAECTETRQGSYGTRQTSGSGYSGGGYVTSVGNTTNVASSVDRATYTFTTGAGSFDVYFRVNTNASADDDSWFYRVDSGSWVTMNNYTNSGWNWIKKSTATALGAGVHTLEVANRENGLKLDKFAVLPASSTPPSGVFGEAYNCTPDVSCGARDCTDGDICLLADELAEGACMPYGTYASGGRLGFTSPRYCDSNYDCGSGKRCAMTLQGNAGTVVQCVPEAYISDPTFVGLQLCASPTWSSVGICASGEVCGAPDVLGYRFCTQQ